MKPVEFDGRLKDGDEIEIQTSALDSPDPLDPAHWQLVAYVSGPLPATETSVTAPTGAKWMRFVTVKNSTRGSNRIGCRVDETNSQFYGRGQTGTSDAKVVRAGLTLPTGGTGVDNVLDHTWADTGGFTTFADSLGFTLSCWFKDNSSSHQGTQFWSAWHGKREGYKGWNGNRTVIWDADVLQTGDDFDGHFRLPRSGGNRSSLTSVEWHPGEGGAGFAGLGTRNADNNSQGVATGQGRDNCQLWANSTEQLDMKWTQVSALNANQGNVARGPGQNGVWDDKAWHHIMVSFDLTTAGAGNLPTYYFDGSVQTVTDAGVDPVGGELIKWSENWKIAFFGLCGGATQGTAAFSNFWMIPEPIDLTVAGNREKFYNAGAVQTDNAQTGAITFPTGGLKTPAYWFPSGNPMENRGSVGADPIWLEMGNYLFNAGPNA
jgi:hypothetical protein